MRARIKKYKIGILCFLLLCGVAGFFFMWEIRTKEGSVTAENYKTVSLALSNPSAANMPVNAQGQEEILKIALTFDDGPHPYYTVQLLDGLKERGVAATFFITGQNAAEYPEIVKRMQEEGHIIGNHTYTHLQLTAGNIDEFRQELIDTNEVIYGITGEETIYVRPPYGAWSKEFEKELGVFPVLWTVDPLDWCSSDTDCIVTRVVSKVKENDIILLHDSYKSTVTATLRIIDRLQGKGYVFVTVDEILFD